MQPSGTGDVFLSVRPCTLGGVNCSVFSKSATLDVSFSLGNADELRTLLSEVGFQRIALTPRSLTIHLPAPERFVQLTVLGAATSILAFAHVDAAARAALVAAVTDETQAVAQRYRDGDTLTFPMFTHIAAAYK
jgi:hypothetical protein